MKGIIFNLFEDYINTKYGEDFYEEILEASDTGEVDPFEIVGPGSYPDETFNTILAQASEMTQKDISLLLREMGRHSLPILADRYPHFFADYHHPREFLKTASMIHQVEVRKLYQGAEVPKFFVEDQDAGGLHLTYKSKRRLCHLVEGLIAGLGDHYRVPVNIVQIDCIQKGDSNCKFSLTFDQ